MHRMLLAALLLVLATSAAAVSSGQLGAGRVTAQGSTVGTPSPPPHPNV